MRLCVPADMGDGLGPLGVGRVTLALPALTGPPEGHVQGTVRGPAVASLGVKWAVTFPGSSTNAPCHTTVVSFGGDLLPWRCRLARGGSTLGAPSTDVPPYSPTPSPSQRTNTEGDGSASPENPWKAPELLPRCIF